MAVDGVLEVPDDASAWLTLGEAAAHLGVSIYTVRRRLKRGELTGRRVRTDHGDVWEVRLTTVPKQHVPSMRVLHQEPEQEPMQQPNHSLLRPSELDQEPNHKVEQRPLEALQDDAAAAEPAGIVELVRLVGRLQEENRQIAGQAGFFRAKWEDVEVQLQRAQETIKMLQAPAPEAPEPADGEDGVLIGASVGAAATTEEVERFKVQLEQVQQRMAEVEATAAHERRPWWKFW